MAQTELKVICKDCGAEFEISAGEQSWYAQKKWELPKRCPDCREARKKQKAKEGK